MASRRRFLVLCCALLTVSAQVAPHAGGLHPDRVDALRVVDAGCADRAAHAEPSSSGDEQRCLGCLGAHQRLADAGPAADPMPVTGTGSDAVAIGATFAPAPRLSDASPRAPPLG